MTLEQLVGPLEGRLGILERRGNQNVVIADITDDSRAVNQGSLFVAVKGERVDGHDFLESALERQAGAIVTQQASRIEAVPTVQVRDSRAALGHFGKPVLRRPDEPPASDRGHGDKRQNDDDLHLQEPVGNDRATNRPDRYRGLSRRQRSHSGFPHHPWSD